MLKLFVIPYGFLPSFAFSHNPPEENRKVPTDCHAAPHHAISALSLLVYHPRQVINR